MANSKIVLLRVKEAAQILTTSDNTVRQMLNNGILHGVKLGTGGKKAEWRIPLSEIERFVSEGAANA